MNNTESLKNTGIELLGNRDKIFSTSKNIIVVGVARGGTSLVSGTLHHLGVFTGELSREPVFEDLKLARALEEKNYSLAQRIIDEYSGQHKVWSFKRPSSIYYLQKMDKMCKNPIFLFIFKDIFSIANRNKISVEQDIIQGLKKAHNDYEKILSFIVGNQANGVLLSYEKIMNNKAIFVDFLSDIVGKENVSKKQKEAALSFIEPNPDKYLDVSRTTKSQGVVETISNEKITGWAKYVYNDKTAVVELYENGKPICQREANLVNKNNSNCFEFDVKDMNVKDINALEVKVSKDIKFLPKKQSTWFAQNQLNNMLDSKYGEADYLRDIGRLLLSKGDLINAEKIASKALSLRPNGPAIVALNDEVKDKREGKT